MKGIILAAGKGTRLYPITQVISKPLLPIYDKPMIYYPLSALLLAGVTDILIIVAPDSIDSYKALLGDGSEIGARLEYAIQPVARGIADAFIIGEDFIGDDSVCLVLGDNIFCGQNLGSLLQKASGRSGATIFGYRVNDPREFGVVEFDKKKKVISLEEKPKEPKSPYAVPGIYFYDNRVVEIAKNLKPSPRGELEITDINKKYLELGELSVQLFGRGITWFDTGSPDGLLAATQFISKKQTKDGHYVACIEEIAWQKGLISTEKLKRTSKRLSPTAYGKYLSSLT